VKYTEADYRKFPGLPRPRKIQTPRTKVSLRYPWKCKTLDDVRTELAKCPEEFRGPFVLEWEGQLINWDDAMELAKK